MVEGAGANKVSGVRVRGKGLPLRNFELHKKEADLLVDLSGDACRIQTYDL